MEGHFSTASVLAISLSALLGSNCANARNTNGAALEDAVMAGKDIRVVLDLARCTERETRARGPAVRGVVRPDAFMITSDHTVAFSNAHFTVRADNRAVQEFNRFRVHRDGRVEFHAIALDPASFSVLQNRQYDCAIASGVEFAW